MNTKCTSLVQHNMIQYDTGQGYITVINLVQARKAENVTFSIQRAKYMTLLQQCREGAYLISLS